MAQEDVSAKSIFLSIDWITIILYLLLVTAGWFSVVGATYNFGDPVIIDFSTRAGRQLVWIGLSLVWAFVLLLVDDRIYDTFSNIFYISFMGLLAVTPFLASNHHGSYSWIDFGPIALQPAEFAKTATALALAKLMGSYGFDIHRTRDFLRASALVLLPIVLIIMERETGSALVYLAFLLVFYREGMSGSVLFVAFAAVVYFVVGLKYNVTYMPQTLTPVGKFSVLLLIWLFTVSLQLFYDSTKKHARNVLLGGLLLTSAAYIVSLFWKFDISWIQLAVCFGSAIYIIILALKGRTPKLCLIALFSIASIAVYYSADYTLNNVLEPHQQTRVKVLLGLEEDPNGAGYNVRQSEIAIGSGGIWGKGFLNGTQTKLNYVPEQDTDFIFCTVGEEMGFIGSAGVLLLFLALILRLIYLAERQRFAMGRIFGYSVLSIFLFHVFINIGMVMGVTPVIGIPLPFFSYGGSSLWGFTILLFIFLRIDAGRNRYGN